MIIHQSWKTREIPPAFREWKSKYVYTLWDDADNHRLIKTHYPWFLGRYESFPSPIMRADAARIFYMHQYGGVYADLDVICLKPIHELLQGHELVLGNMRTEPKPVLPFTSGEWNYLHGVPNAFMASKPGHGFWMVCARKMLEARDSWTVEEVTGPVMIWRALQEYVRKEMHFEESVYIASPSLVFPYSWTWPSGETEHAVCSKQRVSFNATRCLEIVDPGRRAFTITYWTHTWEDKVVE
ncbi:hypothetical protein BCR33DRAFT_712918 [Rhizoclosmatium globosum]|uniref:Glycosyltransferase family 32 protein n=1 Tax=Rhizoclosmatium globosum TaxID=329046 RepID=A0A1Y2CVA4_9FUNG|nr:hypothetical protein BCR33DRAFT_712918 [Rhizoclosmatium globosum]|eukprot:ORY50961.1 hypothetical protein BCR33DRAFT_712918 [Rhizoclosmatium globosum]